jgi:hypothetical protein
MGDTSDEGCFFEIHGSCCMMKVYMKEVCVRNVISGSPDRETDPIRALIGGACRVWQWAPSRVAPQ